MSKVLDAHADELAELIAQHFGGDRNTAVQHQLKELVAKSLSDSRQELLRQFSAEDGHNPLADFKAAVVREVKRSGESHEQADREDRPARGRGEAPARRARRPRPSWPPSASAAPARAATFEQHAFELLERDGRRARRRRAPRRRRALGQRRQEGRHRDRDRRRLGPARGPHRDRREGREALEEPRLGRRSTPRSPSATPASRSCSSPPTRRCPPGASSCTSTRATR